MSPIDILGSLLGGARSGRASSGGAGPADVLTEILGGRASKGAQGKSSGPLGDAMSPAELEEMLGVGRESASPRQPPTAQPNRPAQPRQPQPPSRETVRTAPPPQAPLPPTDIFGQRQRQEPRLNLSVPKPAPLSDNDEAVLLIRAMINAAKVDGEISEEEQANILAQVGAPDQETIKFLRAEFARPLNLVEFAQSLPVGMEQKAYIISLMAVKIDTKEEADYLRDLAKALRISPDECNQIHQQQKATLLYQA